MAKVGNATGAATMPTILSIGRDKTAITARQNYLE
jgi:hypothetical protein